MDSLYLTNLAPVDLEEVVFDDYLNKRITDFLTNTFIQKYLKNIIFRSPINCFCMEKRGVAKQ